jgi:hypothetical protein
LITEHERAPHQGAGRTHQLENLDVDASAGTMGAQGAFPDRMPATARLQGWLFAAAALAALAAAGLWRLLTGSVVSCSRGGSFPSGRRERRALRGG